MLDPNMIRRDMTPDEVLRAMLPVVRDAFAPPWTMLLKFAARGSDDQFTLDDDERIAVSFASHVLPALMELEQSRPGQERAIARDALGWHLTAFRDAWCAAAENANKETT